MVMAAAKQPKGMPISRALVEETTAKRSLHDLMRAQSALDFNRAAAIAFARARAGEDVPAGEVNQILPWIREATLTASLCAIATGDRAACWMGILRDRMFPVSEVASPIEMVVLYAAWRAGAPADQIAREARRIARLRIGYRGYALMYTLATGLGDTNLMSAARHFRITSQCGAGPEFVATIDRILGSSITEILDSMPAELPTQPAARGYTIRIAPRAGRNEPCPCGSGQKFKKCCADKQPQVTPSPVAGLSWDEYVTKGAEHMSCDDVRGLPIKDGFELARAGGFLTGSDVVHLSPLGRDALARGIDEEPSQDVLRLFASVLVLRHPPAWVACWQGDPEALEQALPDSARDVLRDAGLIDTTAEDLQGSAWWSALRHVPLPEETAGLRRAVGDTAEEMSLNHERRRLEQEGHPDLADRIRWVARESPAYGFDLLSFAGRSFNPLPPDAELAIEVKGMAIAGAQLFRLFLTHHEWETARSIGAQHIFHLWEGVRAGDVNAQSAGPRVVRLSDIEVHLPHAPPCNEKCRWETAQVSFARTEPRLVATPLVP